MIRSLALTRSGERNAFRFSRMALAISARSAGKSASLANRMVKSATGSPRCLTLGPAGALLQSVGAEHDQHFIARVASKAGGAGLLAAKGEDIARTEIGTS